MSRVIATPDGTLPKLRPGKNLSQQRSAALLSCVMERNRDEARRMDDRGERLLQALEGILGGWRDDIPVRFYRTFADEPFMTCDYCRRPLLEPGTRHVISKVYAGGELLQELAQCYGCRQE